MEGIYLYQMLYGCNSLEDCTCRFCSSCHSFDVQNIEDTAKSFSNEHELCPRLCSNLSPLVLRPELYSKVLSFQEFQNNLLQDNNAEPAVLNDIFNDVEAFFHILISDDHTLSKDDLVLDDDICDNFRIALVKKHNKLIRCRSSFYDMIKKLKHYDHKDTCHFIRGLIVATLFHNFFGFHNVEQGIFRFLRIINDLKDSTKRHFFQSIANYPKIMKSFVFLIQSHLSAVLLAIPSKTIEDEKMSLCITFLQELSNSNIFLPSSEFVNDIVSKMFNVHEEAVKYIEHIPSILKYPAVLDKETRLNMILAAHFYHYKTITIRINRENLIQEAKKLLDLNYSAFKNKIQIMFTGEDGYDLGGLLSEFIHIVARKLISPEMNLFREENGYMWFNSKDSDANECYRLMGIIMGVAFQNNITIPVKFPKLLFKLIRNAPIELSDIAELKPEVAQSCRSLLEDDNVEEYDLYFTTSTKINDTIKDIELFKGSSNIKVTADNAETYVRLMVDWISKSEFEYQIRNFKKGFYSALDKSFIENFKDDEFYEMICEQNVDWEAIKFNCSYEGYDYLSDSVQLFWKVMDTFDEEQKRNLLFFITGSQTKGEHSKIKIERSADIDRLPTSHTCFSVLVLPDYKDEKTMKHSLEICLNNAEGFGFK